jgi:hypothetical protein
MSVDYKINGVELPLEPTQAAWKDRRVLGYDGNNVAIYEPTYTFVMAWDAVGPDVFYALRQFWLSLQSTISIPVTIPAKENIAYVFETYTGCVVDEPVSQAFFVKFLLRVTMNVRNIVVTG